MPSSGPSRDAVVEAGTRVEAPFVLVEAADPVLSALSQWPGPSLYTRFGDYRGPVDQRIGIGDSIQVTVFEAAAGGLFSSPVTTPNSPGSRTAVIPAQVVAQDGSITVPYAGRVYVAGRRPPEVEKVIVDRLTGKAIEPQAIVTLTGNISNTVTVAGEVTNGARVPLSMHGDRVLDVIAEVGGVKAPVYQTFIEITRGGVTARVPMQALLATPRENIYMRPGDVLTAVLYPQTYTAVGATLKNAVVPFDSTGNSLQEAVAKSGGLVDERADPEGVFVLRYEPLALAKKFVAIPPRFVDQPLVPVAYRFNMRDPNTLLLARRFQMRDKDILFVSNSPIADLTKVLNVVNLLSSPVYSAAYFATQVK